MSGYGYIVEQAESVRFLGKSVVAGRAHECKIAAFHGHDGGAYGTGGRFETGWADDRIAVEIEAVFAVAAHQFDVRARVYQIQIRFAVEQQRLGRQVAESEEAFPVFRVCAVIVIEENGVGDDFHVAGVEGNPGFPDIKQWIVVIFPTKVKMRNSPACEENHCGG